MKYYTLLTQFIQQKTKIIYGNFPILQCFVKTAIGCVNKIYTPYNTLSKNLHTNLDKVKVFYFVKFHAPLASFVSLKTLDDKETTGRRP